MAVDNAASLVVKRLRVIAERAAEQAPKAATTAIGQAAETAVKVTLTSSSHSKGSPTPSRPGMPPSLVSGKLRRSVIHSPARPFGPSAFVTVVGATAIYAASHEHGITIYPRRAPMLAWSDDAGFHAAHSVTLPKRPFMKPATERLIASGLVAKVTSAAFLAGLMD